MALWRPIRSLLPLGGHQMGRQHRDIRTGCYERGHPAEEEKESHLANHTHGGDAVVDAEAIRC